MAVILYVFSVVLEIKTPDYKTQFELQQDELNELTSRYHDNRFVMVGRYSMNPVFSQPGRTTYPMGQGAIGIAWKNRQGISIVYLPHERDTWLKRMSKYGFTESEAKELRMQSTVIAAIRLSTRERSVGLLVFETTTPTEDNHLGAHTLDKTKDSLVLEAITEFLDAYTSEMPRAEITGISKPSPSKPWKQAQQTK